MCFYDEVMPVRKKTKDPKKKYPAPPYPKQEQNPPGFETKMSPDPDFGLKDYTGNGRLTGKVAIITGGDSGIGRAIAVTFAKEGAAIVISYLSEDKDAKITQKAVEDTGRRCLLIKGDIQKESHCHYIIKQTKKNFGRIDILINNAAYQRTVSSITEITKSDLERTFATNIFAMFYLTKAAYPVMEKGGSVINTTSIQGYRPSAKLLAYAATKAAIINFTRGFAEEAIEKGIRVNAVAPGPVWTPLIPSTMGSETTSEFGKHTLFKRAAQPIEIAPIFVFLASDDASYVTGHTYGATGSAMP